ncbi:MAG: tetratricopeptide repeat protein [Acidobacteriaceae bacterium]
MLIEVESLRHRPVTGVELGTRGGGNAAVSGTDGKVLLRLPSTTNPGDVEVLDVLGSPPGRDYVLYSPDDSRIVIPSFSNRRHAYLKIVVVPRGDERLLENPNVLRSFARRAASPLGVGISSGQPSAIDIPRALAYLSSRYGLPSQDIDSAIRAWGRHATTAYDLGLAALYNLNYPLASVQLGIAKVERREDLDNAVRAVAIKRARYADTVCLLSTSEFAEGKYAAAVENSRECVTYRPSNTEALEVLALSLDMSAQYQEASEIFSRALAVDSSVSVQDEFAIARDLNNLGGLLEEEGRLREAEETYRKALAAIPENTPKAEGARAPILNNLGLLLNKVGQSAQAEPLLQQALQINERLVPKDPGKVALNLGNLALVHETEFRYSQAGPEYRAALELSISIPGGENITTIHISMTYATLLQREGDFIAAAALLKKALRFWETNVGPTHPLVANVLSNLAMSLVAEGHLDEAEGMLDRAMSILIQNFGPVHQSIASVLENLAAIEGMRGNPVIAGPLFAEAYEMSRATLGPSAEQTRLAFRSLEAYSDAYPPQPKLRF